MKIVFRVDASLEIGSGHAMRCLSLARFLRDRDENCTFICREHSGNLISHIRSQGFDVTPLEEPAPSSRTSTEETGPDLAHHSWLGVNWLSDAKQTQEALLGQEADWLIVDHYALDLRWESAMRPFCRRIMVVDDLADRDHDCDLLLDQNLVFDSDKRYNRRIPHGLPRLLGPRYGLLHHDYRELHPKVSLRKGAIKRIIVYFGSDSENLNEMTIEVIKSLNSNDLKVDLVVNSTDPQLPFIEQQITGARQFRLFTSLNSLAELMAQADLAIGACGTTAWERCCLGLPSLVITVSENQRPIAAELERLGVIRWLGHKGEVTQSKLRVALHQLMSAGLPEEWSKQCQKLVDGRGVERVAKILMLNPQNELSVREVEPRDEALILEWANDPLTRKNSFISGLIEPAEHHDWFHRRLHDTIKCEFFILEASDSMPIGQVRFVKSNDYWEIHFSINPKLRGRGFGRPVVQKALLAFKSKEVGEIVVGRVKEANHVSGAIFEKLGFVIESEVNGEKVYCLQLKQRA